MGRPESLSTRDDFKYRKGSRIVCPMRKCSEPVGTLKIDLKLGQGLKAADIEYYGKPYKSKESASCRKCGAPWMMNTAIGLRLFINNGWVGLTKKPTRVDN